MFSNQFQEDVPYVELHPTNKCIFKCPWCTYLQFKDRDKGTLTVEEINKVLELNPGYLLICGGGDPMSFATEHQQSRMGLSELLRHLAEKRPSADLHVGTHGGCADLSNELLSCLTDAYRVSISLDASYEADRGPAQGHSKWDSDALNRTLDNVVRIVKARTEEGKKTYVSSTFTRENWARLFVLAQILFDKLKSKGEDPCSCKVFLGCTSIADDSRPSDPYWPSRLTPADILNWEFVRRLVSELDPAFDRFRRERTELRRAPKDKRPEFGIRHCPMVPYYVLAAADGYYYPCCVMAAKRSCRLGKIADTDAKELAIKRKEFHERGTPPMCEDGCRVRDHTFMGGKVKKLAKDLKDSAS